MPNWILTCVGVNLVLSQRWNNAFAAELRLAAAIDVGISRMYVFPLHPDRGYSVYSPVDNLLFIMIHENLGVIDTNMWFEMLLEVWSTPMSAWRGLIRKARGRRCDLSLSNDASK